MRDMKLILGKWDQFVNEQQYKLRQGSSAEGTSGIVDPQQSLVPTGLDDDVDPDTQGSAAESRELAMALTHGEPATPPGPSRHKKPDDSNPFSTVSRIMDPASQGGDPLHFIPKDV